MRYGTRVTATDVLSDLLRTESWWRVSVSVCNLACRSGQTWHDSVNTVLCSVPYSTPSASCEEPYAAQGRGQMVPSHLGWQICGIQRTSALPHGKWVGSCSVCQVTARSCGISVGSTGARGAWTTTLTTRFAGRSDNSTSCWRRTASGSESGSASTFHSSVEQLHRRSGLHTVRIPSSSEVLQHTNARTVMRVHDLDVEDFDE